MKLNIILARYLFIFLLFSVFLLLLFLPVYRYITNFTFQIELDRISSRMEQGIGTFDSVLASLDLIIMSHQKDSRFSELRSWVNNPPGQSELNNISPITLLALRDSINLSLLSHPIPVNAGILFPNGMVVTRNTISHYPSTVPFYGFYLQCGNLTQEEWYHLLISGRPFIPAMSYTRVDNSTYEAITYVTNWVYMGFPKEATFFAVLPVEDIVRLLTDSDVAEMAYIRMYNANGDLLFTRGMKTTSRSHDVNRQSSTHSIRFEISIPDSFIAQKLQPVRNQILLFTCLTAAFIVFLSFLFAWRSSQPERSFLERVRPTGIAHSGFTVFSSLKRTYLDLADVISAEKSHLEISQRTIEAQTALIRTQTIDRIRKALLAGDETMSHTILRDCVAALPYPEDPLISALLNRMLSAMIWDLKEELPGIVPPVEPPDYVGGSQENIFEHYYQDCFTRICESVNLHKEKSISLLGRNVLAYINEHLYDPGIYITMVANHFNISAPTLQKLVKQCTGQTFLIYVEKRRLDRACELLQGSTKTISQIATACGFSSAATFSRSFKRIYGFPPSRLQETRPI